IIDGRITSWFLSTITNPCIWYEIPIDRISSGLTFDSFKTSDNANLRFCHHNSGSCSAQPALWAVIFISCLGWNELAIQLPFLPSINETFTEELPMSNPSKYMIYCVLC